MDPKIIDKVLSKSATPQEAKEVAAWFATDEGQEYFSHLYDRESYLLNEKTLNEWLDNEVPAEKMKTRFLTQIKFRARSFRFRVAAAAIIPLIILGGSLLFIIGRSGVFANNELAEVQVPNGEQLQIILQDGTSVKLNAGSTIQYPKSFGLFNRKVKLIGEGYFAVAKESNRPFIIDLNDISVKVTGTKFNVKAYPEENITVALDEGRVDIIDRNENTYPLEKDQFAYFDRISGICTIDNITDSSEHTAWLTKSLNFYRTPLSEILSTLERQHDVQFIISDPDLLKLKFSISSSNIDVSSILLDLEKVSNIRFISTENKSYEVVTLK